MVYLVTQSIVHCDLSTDNILMDNNYNIKITDFGLSNFMADFESTKKCIRESRSAPEIQKRIEEDDPENTKNVGKRNKQYKGTQNDIFTEKSDVFAYGIVLWELFSKKHANEDELRDYLKVHRDYVDLAMM